MSSESQISEVTRRAIIDNIVLGRISWAGRLTEGEFLSRMYDLTAMPSTDHRYKSAARDIWQHRDTWHDWDDGWVFYDARFNILHETDEVFLRFLCEMVHPVVRSDEEEARSIVRMLNEHLRPDGWELFEKGNISGHPVFSAKETATRSEIFPEPTGWMKVDRQLQEVRLRLETGNTEEQFQAVGLLCREVLITLGQMIYNPEKHKPSDGVEVSETDAKRMLEAFFRTELAGGTTEESRAHATAALRLALALQHKRTADFKLAALCAEATTSVVNIAAIMSGRRELKGKSSSSGQD